MSHTRAMSANPSNPADRNAAGERPTAEFGPLVDSGDFDWSDQRTARATRTTPGGPRGPVAAPEQRLERLVVIRESDRYDRALFDGALRQGWARNSNAPDIDTVIAAGLDPLDHPERCPFEVVPIVGQQFRAAFFALGGCGWVYSPGSAKTKNPAGDNEFTETLCTLIAAHRPVVVDAVAFPRLVRSLDHGPRLGAVCGEYVDRVEAGQYVLDFKEHPEWAQLLWVILSAIASAERDEIQRRHTAGVLVKYLRGHWLLGTRPPFGYRRDPQTHRLEPDASAKEKVEKMLRILVSDLPNSTQVDLLVALGVLPATPAHPASVLRTLIRWGPLYASGKWVQRWTNPVPGLTEWMGLPVIRRTSDEHGHFELVYDVGLPPGGWAPEPLLRDLISLVRATQEQRRGGKRSKRGLAGYRWEGPIGTRRGRRQWRITPYHGHYELRVRVAPVP